MTSEEEQYARLAADLELYCAAALRITLKGGGFSPFHLNSTQRHLHARLEDQLKKKGKVRALVLKARQLGISTYIAARFFHKVTHQQGVRAHILAHSLTTSNHLFSIVQHFYDHCPEDLKPHAGQSNAREIFFDGLKSGYQVSTAGTKETGRGSTFQYLHASEVAFWADGSGHIEGLGQALSGAPGSESILETTANGVGGLFSELWNAAQAGETEYEPIFLPFHAHSEYTATAPAGWSPPDDFKDYAAAYELTPGQIYWAWLTNREIAVANGAQADRIFWKFRREYPASASEAFAMSGDESFISSDRVARARKAVVAGYGGIILGVDPARGGKDKTGIIDRQGRRLGGHVMQTIDSDDLMHIAGVVVRQINLLRPKGLAKVCIDTTGLGGGLYDRLLEMGYGNIVEGVNFGSKALEPDRFVNRRAEMWQRMKDWMDDPAGVQIPDDDLLHSNLCCVVEGRGATRYDSSGRLLLESKDHIRERLGWSPDLGDSACLTFAIDQNYTPDVSAGERYRGRNSHFKGSEAWLGN
jgi:hypothetical protein